MKRNMTLTPTEINEFGEFFIAHLNQVGQIEVAKEIKEKLNSLKMKSLTTEQEVAELLNGTIFIEGMLATKYLCEHSDVTFGEIAKELESVLNAIKKKKLNCRFKNEYYRDLDKMQKEIEELKASDQLIAEWDNAHYSPIIYGILGKKFMEEYDITYSEPKGTEER